jgi:hypothetical protein
MPRRFRLVGLVAGLAAVILGSSVASYDGYCFNEARFLSDREDFDAAISQIIERSAAQLITTRPTSTVFDSVRVIKYPSRETFYRANPNCCRVVPHNVSDDGPYTSFSQRLFGYAARIVAITYVVDYVDVAGERKGAMKTERFAVTNCGRAWNATH